MCIPLIVILTTGPLLEPAQPEKTVDELAWARIDPALHAEPAYLQGTSDGMGGGAVFEDEDAWYLHAGLGLVTTESDDLPDQEIDFDDGVFVAIAVGRHFGAGQDRLGFDVELEGVWTDQDTEGDIDSFRDYNTIGVLVNGLVDFRLVDRLFLYGGAGVGTSWIDVNTGEPALGDFSEDDGPHLTWQLKAGLQWLFNEDWSANLGYRFLNINDIEISDEVGTENFDIGTEQHVLELGVGFRF